jgi:hypothetical protein
MQTRLLLIIGVLSCLPTDRLYGQTPTPAVAVVPPPYTPLLYDIDWTYLQNPAADRDWTDRLHYV